jgi:hypothetical protein
MHMAFVRDSLRPTPCEQLLHDCAWRLPRVTYDPTCTKSSIGLPRHDITTLESALANTFVGFTAMYDADCIQVCTAQKRRTCIDPGIGPSSPGLALVAPFRVNWANNVSHHCSLGAALSSDLTANILMQICQNRVQHQATHPQVLADNIPGIRVLGVKRER